jgi:hypothetical protein
VLAAAALLAAGCGGDDASAERQVRDTVSGYFTSLSSRDFPAACSALSPSFRRELAAYAVRAFPDLGSTECEPIASRIAAANGERAVELQRRVRVGEVSLDGDRATARLGPGQSAELRRVDGAWLIDAIDFSGATG